MRCQSAKLLAIPLKITFSLAFWVLSAFLPATAQDVLTYHNDNARTGQNLNETILNPTNVTSNTFGRLFTISVDGKVDAQPLYASAVFISGKGIHNVLFVATEHDSVYALDADTGGVLWQVSLLQSGETTPTTSDVRGCGQVAPEIGVTSTPVIDRHVGLQGILYAVAMSKDGAGNYFQRLHALNIATGQEQFGGPVDIQAVFPGTGDNSSGGNVVFDPRQYKERAGLLLLNHVVYTAWSSHCDIRPYTGWVIGYDQSSLKQVNVLNITPNGAQASIWASGGGPATDSDGNVYVLAANGTFDTTLDANGFPSGGDYGNAFLKISTTNNKLSVADYFAMFNAVAESNVDEDLGSGGAMVLPDLTDALGRTQHLAVGAGKDGVLYLVNRDNMGKFNANNNDAIYQGLPGALAGPEFSMPAYFNNKIYYGAVNDSIRAFAFVAAKLLATPASQTSHIFPYPGATPSVSANGTSNGIVWVTENTNSAILHAYDAEDLTHELYNSVQAPGGRDQFGVGNKYITPTIANGKVYVGTTNGVGVFGLLQLQSATELSPSNLTFGAELVSARSAAQPVTLANRGSSALTISSVATSADFTQTNTCGTSVGAGASCTINITFTPTQGGSRTGTLTVSDSAPGSPHTVALSGTGQDFSIGIAAGSSASATVTAGQSAAYNLTITPLGGFNQAVALICSGAPSEAACSVSPSSVTPNGSTASSVSVMVTTTAPGMLIMGMKLSPPSSGRLYYLAGVLALAWALVMLARLALGTRRKVLLGAAAFALGLSVVFVMAMAACGGSNPGGGANNPGTAGGTYTLTVSGSVSVSSTSLTHNLSLTLQVN
jgi:Abnormal spindle-like microcephaly-assoc'd, ASPM-SPD-2-Hydin/PQQ enzyme repeat